MQRGAGRSVGWARRGWDFGVQYVLETLFQDDTFRAAADGYSSKNPGNDPDHLLSGSYFRNIDADTGYTWSRRARSDDCGMYVLGASRSSNFAPVPLLMCTLWHRSSANPPIDPPRLSSLSTRAGSTAGVDGGQIYKRKSHSTFLVGIRRIDVAAEYSGKKATWAPLIVTEGPTEPPSLSSIIQPTVDFFKAHCPGVHTACASVGVTSADSCGTRAMNNLAAARGSISGACRSAWRHSKRDSYHAPRWAASPTTPLGYSGLHSGGYTCYGAAHDAVWSHGKKRVSTLLYPRRGAMWCCPVRRCLTGHGFVPLCGSV